MTKYYDTHLVNEVTFAIRCDFGLCEKFTTKIYAKKRNYSRDDEKNPNYH